jgi:hypothetical protein
VSDVLLSSPRGNPDAQHRADLVSCSQLSRVAGEQPDATSPQAVAWLAIEQPGAWGRDALEQSRIDSVTLGTLKRAAQAADVRIVLIRRPGRSAPSDRGQRVLLAYTHPKGQWAEMRDVTDLRSLRDLDLAAVAAGERQGFGEDVSHPVLLACANAKRDQCCALRGRRLAQELSVRYPGAVWESSHLGGHRFAPTAVMLPSGYLFGGLSLELAAEAMDAAAAGRVVLSGLRGRSTWSRVGQMAEIAVRRATGESRISALTSKAPTWSAGDVCVVPVSHRDGRLWAVEVESIAGAHELPTACGGPAQPVSGLRARRLWWVR